MLNRHRWFLVIASASALVATCTSTCWWLAERSLLDATEFRALVDEGLPAGSFPEEANRFLLTLKASEDHRIRRISWTRTLRPVTSHDCYQQSPPCSPIDYGASSDSLYIYGILNTGVSYPWSLLCDEGYDFFLIFDASGRYQRIITNDRDVCE
jgi:hypothetical protein